MIKQTNPGCIVLVLASLFAVTANAQLTRLPAPRIVQKGSTCWAASATVVLSLYNKMPGAPNAETDPRYLGLCEAINEDNWFRNKYQNTGTDCCLYWMGLGAGEPAQCTHSGAPDKLFDLYELSWVGYGRALTQAELTNEVVNNYRPSSINRSPKGGGGIGHYMTIVGYDPTTTDVYVMDSADNINGGFWSIPYVDLVGGRPADTWVWDYSFIFTQDRAASSEQFLLNARELPAGAAPDMPTPQDHEAEWHYYIRDPGKFRIGPYVFGNGATVLISTTHDSFSYKNVLLRPGTRIIEGARVSFWVGP